MAAETEARLDGVVRGARAVQRLQAVQLLDDVIQAAAAAQRLVEALLVVLGLVHGGGARGGGGPRLGALRAELGALADVEGAELGGVRVLVVGVGALLAARALDVGVVLLAGPRLVVRAVAGAGRLGLGPQRDVQVPGGALPVAAVQHLVDDAGRGVVARLRLALVARQLAPPAYLLVAAVRRQRLLVAFTWWKYFGYEYTS